MSRSLFRQSTPGVNTYLGLRRLLLAFGKLSQFKCPHNNFIFISYGYVY